MGKRRQFREGKPQPPASPAPTFLTSGCFVLRNVSQPLHHLVLAGTGGHIFIHH